MMFELFLVTVLSVVTVSASYKEKFNNFIDYNDVQHGPPYSYHDNTLKYGQVITAGHHYDNTLEYGQVLAAGPRNTLKYGQVLTAEPHYDNTLKYGQVITAEPYLESRYEHLRLPVVSSAEVYQSSASSSSVEIASGNTNHGRGSVIKAFAFGLIRRIPALIFGVVAAVGVCLFTSFCSNLTRINSLFQLPFELRTLVTPERIHLATDFVKDAIMKYNSL